jgi:hypothetical protein
MLLAEPQKMFDIFSPDDVPFLEGASLEFILDDLGYIMGQDHPHRLCHRNSSFQRYFSHSHQACTDFPDDRQTILLLIRNIRAPETTRLFKQRPADALVETSLPFPRNSKYHKSP